jgi:prevent-host-death family protein
MLKYSANSMCYIVYMTRRRRLGVRQMRQNLSVYLRRVGSGETFEVTARGRPVAVLAPIEDDPSPIYS